MGVLEHIYVNMGGLENIYVKYGRFRAYIYVK
jgi:hypothetical protein